MFIMVSRCPERVASQADRCLGGQFACIPMYCTMFLLIIVVVDMTIGGWGCCFGDNEGYSVGINNTQL
jgi:hypothetical protein